MSRKTVLILFGAVCLIGLLGRAVVVNRMEIDQTFWPPVRDARGEAVPEILSRVPARPWPEATTVRLYTTRLGTDGLSEKDAFGRALSPAQRAAFEATLWKKKYRYGDWWTGTAVGCFVPPRLFRYFDDSGVKVGEIAVTFGCTAISAQPQLVKEIGGPYFHPWFGLLEFDEARLKVLLTSWGVSTGENDTNPPDEARP